MDHELKKSIIILALNNLIETYSIALVNDSGSLNSEEKDCIKFQMESAMNILKEYADTDENIPAPKPQWKDLK